MRELVKKAHPHILVYGCLSHAFNLLENAITPKSVISHVVEINKYFKSRHEAMLGMLMEKDGKSPQLCNATRWNSQLACVSTFLENFSKYREIALILNAKSTKSDDDLKKITKKLNDMNLYKNTENLNEQLKLVGAALDTVFL